MAISIPSAPKPTDDPGDVPIGFVGDDGKTRLNLNRFMYNSFPFFYGQLRDDKNERMIVEEFHEEWGEYMQQEALLVLMAPRDHGKSNESQGFVMWRAWRHNRDRDTGLLIPAAPDGQYEAVVFSETLPQAGAWFEKLQAMLLANAGLFADILPEFSGRSRRSFRDVWSRRRMRLRNGFECSIRAFRTSTRGLHPDLILLDDVLSEKNSLTAYQRNKVWTYFVGTLMPMNARQMIIIGTTQHYDDLLHRLRPRKDAPDLIVGNRRVRFRWLRYKAVDWDAEKVLWPGRHGIEDLKSRRAQDVLLFSREFQNEPRDDAASMFPWPLTGAAVTAGEERVLLGVPAVDALGYMASIRVPPGMPPRPVGRGYTKQPGETVVLGMDLAMSEAVGADYTVVWVASYNRPTQIRTSLWCAREKGLTFDQQIELLRYACGWFGVDLGIIEDNGFQKWLWTASQRFPETAGKLIGHRTGREKQTLSEGVPSLKLALLNHLWAIPSGDRPSLEFAHVWQSEMAAMGWKDDKLQGVGEHDDTVMGFWFTERAVRLVDEWMAQGPAEQIVTGEDMGIDRYRISPDY